MIRGSTSGANTVRWIKKPKLEAVITFMNINIPCSAKFP
jgi:hypothetical protein